MNNQKRLSVAKGLIHCHTEWSYDSTVSLSALRSCLQSEGFSFAAITDHSRDMTPEKFQKLVVACRNVSTDGFIALPGLEIRLDNGDEVAAIGITNFIEATSMNEIGERIREQGGYSVWVHPYKKRKPDLRTCSCDAIEVLNGKIDGKVAPNLTLLLKIKRLRLSGKHVRCIFGDDLHELEAPRNIWTECFIRSLSHDEILKSLKNGHYVNRVGIISISSEVEDSLSRLVRCVLSRTAYISWNFFLGMLPEKILKTIIRRSRRLVSRIKTAS